MGTSDAWPCLKNGGASGVGSALMERLLREARDRQVPQVTLNAQAYVTDFYRKFGFEATGEDIHRRRHPPCKNGGQAGGKTG